MRPGKTGAEEIQKMMTEFRENPPKEIGGSPLVTIKDYLTLKATDVKMGDVALLDFPTTSNVLQYFTEDGSKISIRPSGTEPKIKFYIEVHDKMASKADYDRCNAGAAAKIARIKKELGI